MCACILLGCDQETGAPVTESPEVSGSLLWAEGCKSEVTRGDADRNSTCMRFDYDAGKQQLTLHHVNAAFNCCPEEIIVEVEKEDNVIRIIESQRGPNCRCDCLYDLAILVEHVPAAAYMIIVEETRRNEKDTRIEFAVDLNVETDGIHCVPRNHYPYGL
ncbi:MAG: hypothetical protein KFH87_03390 [Bacteroidetes bacterium]|nr:hypothetical protein [Bacteroidota bacterium]